MQSILLFFLRRAALGAVCVALQTGCTNQSPLVPPDTVAGFTRTDNLGGVIGDADGDDWRTAEFYQNDIFVKPAYPNPSNGTTTVRLDYARNSVLPELVIYANNLAGNPVLLGADINPPLGSRFYNLNLLPLAPSQSVSELKGKLIRVFLYDASGRLISYGDVQVE